MLKLLVSSKVMLRTVTEELLFVLVGWNELPDFLFFGRLVWGGLLVLFSVVTCIVIFTVNKGRILVLHYRLQQSFGTLDVLRTFDIRLLNGQTPVLQ